jgi:hypothetical protein
MNSPERLLQYSFPGLLVSVYAFCVYTFAELLARRNPPVSGPLFHGFGAVVAGSVAVVIGVVMFQIYWLGYGPFFCGRLLARRFVKLDRGRAVLLSLLPDQLEAIRLFYKPDLDLTLHHRITTRRFGRWLRLLELDPTWKPSSVPGISPDARDRYARDWHKHWDIVCVLVDHAASQAGQTIRVRHSRLSETYHMLGACRTAIGWGGGLGIVGVVLHAHLQREGFLPLIPGVASAVVVTVALCVVFHHARASTEKRNVTRLGLSLRTYYAERPRALGALLRALDRESDARMHPE